MKNILLWACLLLSIFLSSYTFANNDRLEDAFDQSHNQQYSVQADAKDLFDTQIDLIWSIKKWLESNWNVNDLIDQYKQWVSLDPDIDQAIQDYLAAEGLWKDLGIAKVNLMNAIDGAPIALNDSVFVRATRFMMKATVILAIPMMIFAALKLIFSMWDEAKLKESLIQIWYVAWWVVLALMSVMIIYFITALTRSNIWAI